VKTADVEKLFREGGALSEKLSGYRPRPGQIALAKLVSDSVQDGRHLLCEAPTGTGKSMAFGIPTAIWAIENDEKVVVVTSNITLQEQLINKDLPLIAKVLDGQVKSEAVEEVRPFRFGLMKGIGNYICPTQVDVSIDELRADGKDVPAWLLGIKQSIGPDFEGDRSKQEAMFDDEQWSYLGVSSSDCTKEQCRYHREGLCPWRRARQGLELCHLIVTNYHYFYSDIEIRAMTAGNAAILPDHKVVVFDEAHDAPFIAMDFLGFQMAISNVLSLAKRAKRLTDMTRQDHDVVESVKQWADEFYHALPSVLKVTQDQWGKSQTSPILTDPLELDAGNRLVTSLKLLGKLFKREAMKYEGGGHEQFARYARWLGTANRTVRLANDIETVNSGPFGEEDVYYVEKGSGESLYTVCCKKVGVGEYFQERVFPYRTVIAVSATLTAGNSFEYVSGKFGLGPDDYVSLIAPSPFDASRVLAVIPPKFPAPGKVEFIPAVTDVIRKVIDIFNGRTMALFTSHANLRAVAVNLHAVMPKLRVLVQGQMPKMKIISEMKRQPVNTVILATSSFWQGIDLPGRDLMCVVIDKIPFARPDDPILYYYEKIGGDGFYSYSVPRATIALKQGIGRLIRTETDYGVVVVLDARLKTKAEQYGNDLLAAFPTNCFQAESVDDIPEFLREFENGDKT